MPRSKQLARHEPDGTGKRRRAVAVLLEERDARLQPAHVVPQPAVLDHGLQQALGEFGGHYTAPASRFCVVVVDSLVYKFFSTHACSADSLASSTRGKRMSFFAGSSVNLVRDSEAGVDAPDFHAQHITQKMCAYAQTVSTVGNLRSQLDHVPGCLQNVVNLVNELSRPFLGSLFQIDYVEAPTNAQQLDTMHYYLQVTCKFYATDDVQSTNIIDASREAVVSRLYILVSKRTTELPKFKKPYPDINVCMDHGATAICVREMHLAAVLRICALLLAQQIAYCGGAADSVCFEGEAVSDATIKIYSDLFENLHTAEDITTGDILSEAKEAHCLELHAQVLNPGASIPQTIINASTMLSKCRAKSADFCHESLPRQIRRLTDEVRTRKTAKVDTKTPAASALFLHPHCQTQSLLPVCYVRCCVLKPVYFE